jgi:hypothetical protein
MAEFVQGTGGCLSMVIDRERIPGFRFPSNFGYMNEDFYGWLSIIQQGQTGHRLPADLGRYRLPVNSRSSSKRRAATDAWKVYREYSKLPVLRAALWWTLYVWNSFWLYRHARPR